MPKIQFAGAVQEFSHPVTVLEAAEAFDKNLAKKILAGRVNDRLLDTSILIENDAKIEFITEKNKEGLDIIRHSCAHLLAQAVKQLFPEAQVTIGPVIEDGFYYDFACPHTFTEEDLEKIEKRMHELSKAAQPVKRTVMSRSDAVRLFEKMGEKYKVDIISSIPDAENLSFYQQGDFVDLCRGPHVPNTANIKVFKLTKLAGAYWRGDAKNEMLQRIYGTAWTTEEELQSYLKRIEEAEKRDHRKLGKQLHLFHFQEEAPGMIFWHPKGWAVFQAIEQYLRQLLSQYGYQEVRTPQLLDRSLWEKTGHWQNFHDNMFALKVEERDYAIKPMNCPCHVQIFNQGLKSYRDLPLRLSEFGSCHRREPSGSLHGLLRVRNFVQDDAHIFCTEDQIQSEVAQFIDLLYRVYQDFGFTEVIIRLATRPDKRVGEDALWDKAELALETALHHHKLPFLLAKGEGAFYGPKIEFSLKDCLGRIWQCGTIQVDFNMTERLGAQYIAEDNNRKTPVMLHRAIFGSLERFIGILIEETAGILPLWLAPIQAVVMNISDSQASYVKKVVESLSQAGYRVIEDIRNEKVGFKIREHTLQKVPYLLVVGDREVEAESVSVRTLSGENLGSMTLQVFSDRLAVEIQKRSRVA